MKIALCMFKYFPFGGLSRDLVKITKYLISKNHYVEIFVQEWDGEIIRDSKINIISCHSLTNHGRAIEYCTKLKLLLQNNNFDITIGFNKIPNLDFYYAADTCFLEKLYSTKSKVEQILYKATRRYKIFSTLERTVFSKNNHTKILFIDKSQVEVYRKYYKFGNDKYIILPPSLSIENLEVVPIEKRKAITIVQVGSDFKRKGVDRSLKAIASLPIELQNKIQFLIIGEGDKTRYNEYISKHRLDSIVKFLGPLRL